MKHWSEFLNTRTHVTKRLGKMANAISFDVQSKELELQATKQSLERLEDEICFTIASNFTNENDYENAIKSAKIKADVWNNSPIETHKPIHK